MLRWRSSLSAIISPLAPDCEVQEQGGYLSSLHKILHVTQRENEQKTWDSYGQMQGKLRLYQIFTFLLFQTSKDVNVMLILCIYQTFPNHLYMYKNTQLKGL